MQTYPISLTQANPGRVIAAQGDLFVYESAEAGSRTNLLGYSEQFDAWAKALVTVTANAVTAPDGSGSAEKIVGTGGYWWIQQGVAAAAGIDYIGSVWMKAPVAGPMKLTMLDQGGVPIQVLVCDCTTEWQRFSLPVRAPVGTTSLIMRIGHDVAKEAHVFGAMIEKSAFLGSYVPSLGAGAGYGPGELRIRVQPDTGGDIVLRPGQRFRSAEPVTNWTIKAVGNESLDASVIIGSGEFDDANTKNVFKLDASFANSVSVTNTVDTPVPVNVTNAQIEIINDVGNRIPVALDPTQLNLIQTAAPVMAYTNAKSSIALTTGAYSAVITPAENVNGVIIEQIIPTVTGTLVAKATSPVMSGGWDGDALAVFGTASADVTRRKVAAGKGVYMFANGNGLVHVLYSVL